MENETADPIRPHYWDRGILVPGVFGHVLPAKQLL
jgi:hypothetical protein